MSVSRRGDMLALALSYALAGVAKAGHQALDMLSNAADMRSFGQRYGSNPARHNGGPHRGVTVAAMKRAKTKRRNIAKHPRCVGRA